MTSLQQVIHILQAYFIQYVVTGYPTKLWNLYNYFEDQARCIRRQAFGDFQKKKAKKKKRWTWRTEAIIEGHQGKESTYNAGDQGSKSGSGRSSGEGNGNPLQYSCRENPMDRGAWRATVSGVAKSWTELSDSHRHTHTPLHQMCLYGEHHS